MSQQKINFDFLLDWFEKNARDLPWRSNVNPYHVWLAEVMSQQTQMTTLVPFFFRFIEKLPSVKELADAEEVIVLSLWSGLGYYSRARNLHRAAKMIMSKFGGDFPKTYEEWLMLPGIGPYSAAAISSQSFNEKKAVWDGNVRRVMSRVLGEKKAWEKSFEEKCIGYLNQKIQKYNSGQFNQALMELGALVCSPKIPRCSICPLIKNCIAHKSGNPLNFPEPKVRPSFVEVKTQSFILVHQDKVYLEPRDKTDWYFGLWDFPSDLGGRLNPKRKLSDSWGAVVNKNGVNVGSFRHSITKHKIQMSVQKIEVKKIKKNPEESGRWFDLDLLYLGKIDVPLATTAKKALKVLAKAQASFPL